MDVDSLNMTIDLVAKEKDIPREVLVQAIESSIETAAHRVFGGERELEALYNPEVGQVELFQYMEVADEIESEEKAITLEQAKLVDPEAEIGDELGFQIFYLDADKDRAEEEDKKYGDILGIRQSRSTFGRIAAQTAAPAKPPVAAAGEKAWVKIRPRACGISPALMTSTTSEARI